MIPKEPTVTTPDPPLRDLVARALSTAEHCVHPGHESCDVWHQADAVLAAVEPVIRRQERAATAEKIADAIWAHEERYGGRATRYAIGHSDALQTAAAIARSHAQLTEEETTNG